MESQDILKGAVVNQMKQWRKGLELRNLTILRGCGFRTPKGSGTFTMRREADGSWVAEAQGRYANNRPFRLTVKLY